MEEHCSESVDGTGSEKWECRSRKSLAVTTDRQREWGDELSRFATFIVRVSQDSAGTISGVVEQVRTGERVRFHGLAAVSGVIARMIEEAAET